MRYHGNYCGPGWSAGKYQSSVVSSVPAVDEFDDTCKEHDASYAMDDDLLWADLKFAGKNLVSLRPKRMLAGALVGVQGVGRSVDRLFQPKQSTKASMTNNLRQAINNGTCPRNVTRGAATRGGKPTQLMGKSAQQKRSHANGLEQVTEVLSFRKIGGGTTRVTAPLGISQQFRPAPAIKTQVGDGVRIKTTVMAGRATAATQSAVPEITFSFPITPLATNNAEIQQLCQLYEQFRFNSITIRFHPYQGTNSGGEVMLVVHERAIDILPNADSSTFYSRCLTGHNTALTPLWCPIALTPTIDTSWKVVDSYNTGTLEECTSGFIYMLTDGTTAIPGYLALDIDMQFATMKYNPRSVVSGSYQGPSLGFTATLTTAASAAGTNFLMTVATAAFTPGDIYHTTFLAQGSTPPTGTTFANLLQISNGSGTATPYTLRSNSTLFARALTATTIQLYYTWAAANQGTSAVTDADDMQIATTTSAVGSFRNVRFTQLKNATAPTN